VSTRHLAALLVAVATLLAGCRVDVTTAVEVAADGSGDLAITVAVDAETAADLAAVGLSLRPPAVAGWQSEESSTDEAHTVVLTTSFDSAPELSARVAELGEGLDEEDPAVLRDVVLDVADDGGAQFDGTAGLLLPSSAGADAAGFPSAEELRAMATDVTATLVVTLPGTVTTSNATTVDGSTATWDLPVGSMVAVSAVSEPPSFWQQGWVPWAAGVVAAVLVLVLVARLRARRRARVEAPLGRVDRMRMDR
jgi:hypothetical protein